MARAARMPETMSSSMFRAGEEMMDDRIRMKRNSTIKEAIKLTKQVVEVIKGVEIIPRCEDTGDDQDGGASSTWDRAAQREAMKVNVSHKKTP